MVFTKRWILKPQKRKKNKKQTKKLSYSHIASKLRKNRSEFVFLTVCRYDIYNIIFVSKTLHIFPIERIIQNKSQITVDIGLSKFEVFIIRLHLLFLAAQFRIWIGMVGHSAEFYFSVSGFVSFSQCHFSYFVYALKKPFP